VFGYSLDLPGKAYFFSIYVSYWLPDVYPAVWISIFFVLPILFNMFNVRKYGEIEFILTSFKVISIVGIVILGLIIVGGGELTQPRLGTDSFNRTIPCDNTTTCLQQPGFRCIPPSDLNS